LYLAWYAVPGLFWNAEENRLWLAAGRNLLEIFHRCGGVRAVFAGTCAEYEPGHELCVENQTPLCPVSLYGACKGELCQYATAFAEKNSVSMAWGRVFHLYGPHEPSQRFVPAVVRALLCQQEAGCTAGTQVRDFLHVCDVATAFVALLQSPVEGAVNIASGQPVRLAEMAQNIARQIGAESLLKLGALPMSAGDPAVLTAATHRLNQEVNWWPAISLEQGLAETIAWWRERLV
jgi:nucleoside-diphosphate-sugar epimerase